MHAGKPLLMLALALAAAGCGPAVSRQEPAPSAAATRPAVLTLDPTAAEKLQETILAAYHTGVRKIVLSPGTYRLAMPKGEWHLNWRDLDGLEIDGTGATLIEPARSNGAMHFLRCRNLTLRGFTLQHEVVPFTQGTLEAVDPQNRWIDVRIHDGYPADLDSREFFAEKPAAYVFSRGTQRIKPGSFDLYPSGVERREAGLFRLHFAAPLRMPREVLAPGEWVAFRGRGGREIVLESCERVTVSGVTIHGGASFGIHEAGGEGFNRYSYTVTYPPKPEGATAPPLFGSCADAFHSSNVRHGPVLEGCRFEGMGDDGIPIHGIYALVAESTGNTLVTLSKGATTYRPGDPLRLLDAKGNPLGEATVSAVENLPEYRLAQPTANKRFADASVFTRLTLDRPLPATFECLASNPAACGNGFAIRGNVIRNHRARGLLIKAGDGVIEDNVIEGSSMSALLIAPEFFWNEADYVRNVMIRRNTFRAGGYASAGPWTAHAGVVTVGGEGTTPGHRNVVIEENTFEDNNGINLLVECAQDVTIRNNRFLRAQHGDAHRGQEKGLDPRALIWLAHSSGIRLEGNRIDARGRFGNEVVHVGPDVTGLTANPMNK